MPTKTDILTKLQNNKLRFIDAQITAVDAEVRALQKELLDFLFQNFVTELNIVDGALVSDAASYRALNKLDAIFDQFKQTFTDPFAKGLGDKMLKVIDLTERYYSKGLRLPDTILQRAKRSSDFIYERIGIDQSTGQVIEGSYLDNIATMPEVRNEIKDYVLQNVTNKTGLRTFQKGFKELLEGSPDVDGAMLRYNQQYTFDAFNQADEAVNEVFAEEAGLRYFVYSGTVIQTTRCFCAKRNNKVFSVEDTKKWKNDPTLIDKKTKASYNPLIERGRYNCRHSLQYIDEVTAMQMGYDKSEAKEINQSVCLGRK